MFPSKNYKSWLSQKAGPNKGLCAICRGKYSQEKEQRTKAVKSKQAQKRKAFIHWSHSSFWQRLECTIEVTQQQQQQSAKALICLAQIHNCAMHGSVSEACLRIRTTSDRKARDTHSCETRYCQATPDRLPQQWLV